MDNFKKNKHKIVTRGSWFENINKKSVLTIVICILLLITLYSGYMIVSILLNYKAASNEYKDIANMAVSQIDTDTQETGYKYLSINEDKLLSINEDYMFWIDIPYTNISYPVLYTDDYEKYLHTTFEGKANSSGALFIDYKCKKDISSKNTIIYGHNMKDGSMFNDICNYNNENYFNEHREIYIYRAGHVYHYTAFAFFETTSESSVYTIDFSSDNDYMAYINSIQSNSWYKSDIVPKADDQIITISTCSRTNSEYRWVLLAVLVYSI